MKDKIKGNSPPQCRRISKRQRTCTSDEQNKDQFSRTVVKLPKKRDVVVHTSVSTSSSREIHGGNEEEDDVQDWVTPCIINSFSISVPSASQIPTRAEEQEVIVLEDDKDEEDKTFDIAAPSSPFSPLPPSPPSSPIKSGLCDSCGCIFDGSEDKGESLMEHVCGPSLCPGCGNVFKHRQEFKDHEELCAQGMYIPPPQSPAPTPSPEEEPPQISLTLPVPAPQLHLQLQLPQYSSMPLQDENQVLKKVDCHVQNDDTCPCPTPTTSASGTKTGKRRKRKSRIKSKGQGLPISVDQVEEQDSDPDWTIDMPPQRNEANIEGIPSRPKRSVCRPLRGRLLLSETDSETEESIMPSLVPISSSSPLPLNSSIESGPPQLDEETDTSNAKICQKSKKE